MQVTKIGKKKPGGRAISRSYTAIAELTKRLPLPAGKYALRYRIEVVVRGKVIDRSRWSRKVIFVTGG